MMFPEEKDLQRIIDMAGMDEGFFSIAVYSFIERYMKDYINDQGIYTVGDFDDKFKDMLVKFWGSKYDKPIEEKFNRYGGTYLWPLNPDYNFNTLFPLCDGKGAADKVRHRFNYQSLDQLETSISHLQTFVRIAGEKDAVEKFQELNKHLENWDKRENSEKLQKQVDELNSRILKFIQSNGDKIKTIDQLQAAKQEYEERIAELEKQVSSASSSNTEADLELQRIRKENDLLLEYIENLRQLTSYTRTRHDYETSITRLSLDQMRAVNQYDGSQKAYLITGTAGTGKSLVLVKIIEKLLSQAKENNLPEPKYLLATFTNTLVKYCKYTASLLEGADRSSTDPASSASPSGSTTGSISDNIMTTDKFLTSICRQIMPRLYFMVAQNNESQKDLTSQFLKKHFKLLDTFSRFDAAEELTNNIWPNFLSKEDFLESSVTLNPNTQTSKEDIWKIHKACVALAEKALRSGSDYFPPELVYYMMARYLKENPSKQLDYIFVDEAQDLTTSKLICLQNLADHFVVAADDSQAIYGHNINWEKFSSTLAQNRYDLKTNFRNTIQINNFAERYRTKSFGTNTETATTATTLPAGFRNGPEVEVYKFETKLKNYSADNLRAIKEKVNLYVEELGYSPDNICILVSRNIETFGKSLQDIGLEVEILKDMEEFNSTGKVKLSSIHSAKGLSFPIVLFATGEDGLSTSQTEEYQQTQRNLYYVAMSRAMDILNVFMLESDMDIPYIGDISKIQRG